MGVKSCMRLVGAAAVAVVCWAGMATGQSQVAVFTFDDFRDRIAEYENADGDVVIEVGENITIGQIVIIPEIATEGRTLTIRSVNTDAPVILRRGVRSTDTSGLFNLRENVTLILEDIIIDGDRYGAFADGGGSLIETNGSTLIMNDGAILRNNVKMNGSNSGLFMANSTFIMNGGEISGNAVISENAGISTSCAYMLDGTFIMTGGKISGNTDHAVYVARSTFTMTNGEISGNNGSGSGSSGVYVVNGTFIMDGGKISDHRDGGVVLTKTSGSAFGSTFTMTNGEISGNSRNTRGGGIRIIGSTFTMDGGKISGNTAGEYGGGIDVTWVSGDFPSIFTMTNGEISGNTCTGMDCRGGGVFINGSTFTMDGGKISENTTGGGAGSGVFVGSGDNDVSSTFTMTNGEISGNTCIGMDCRGGGVFINGSTFTMDGGKISGNTVTGYYSDGGGVGVGRSTSGISSTFTMTNGEISGNSSEDVGGGVSVGGGTFTMEGGKINDNTASTNGGGVFITAATNDDNPHTIGTFTMTSGDIHNNTAVGGGGVSMLCGIFTMSGGNISSNIATYFGGGVLLDEIGIADLSYVFTMSGGKINGNTAAYDGGGVMVNAGTFNLAGGVVAGVATGINNLIYVYGGYGGYGGTYNFNTSPSPAPNNAIVIAWAKPSGSGPFSYAVNTTTNLLTHPSESAAFWDTLGVLSGVSYINGSNTGFIDFPLVSVTGPTSVLFSDRDFPPVLPEAGASVVSPSGVFSSSFSAGPNPVSRHSGVVNFFRSGSRILSSSLSVYDASGNFIVSVKVADDLMLADGHRPSLRCVGSWDLRDGRGRLVSGGSYLVRGTLSLSSGVEERVSLVIGVR